MIGIHNYLFQAPLAKRSLFVLAKNESIEFNYLLSMKNRSRKYSIVLFHEKFVYRYR